MAITFADVSDELLQTYEEILRSYYLELDPEADVANGSAIHELVIRPAAAIYARNEVELEDLRNQYSLNLLAQQASPSDSIADNLAANFKVTRREGTQGSGTVAVYTKQTGNVYVNQGATFSAAGTALVCNLNYVGVLDDTGFVDTDTVKYKRMMAVGEGEYAFLVPLSTVDATAASIAEGTPVTQDAVNTQVSRIEVASAIAGGSTRETTAELVARVETGITAKVPSGRAHIQALLLDQTDVPLLDLAVTGMGDPEMLRDRNSLLLASSGGRVDAFCRTAQLPATTTVELACRTADGRRWTAYVPRDVAPGWYHVSRITRSGTTRAIVGPEGVDVVYLWQEEEGGPEVFSGLTARYSPYQAATISFDWTGLTGATESFLVSFAHMPRIEELQAYLSSEDVKARNQDILVRAPVPLNVGMDLSLRILSGTAASVDLPAVASSIANYVNGLAMGRGFLSTADLAVLIGTTYPNLAMDFPATLRYWCPLPDGTIRTEESSVGMLEAPEILPQGVSAANSAFICRTEDIALSTRS